MSKWISTAVAGAIGAAFLFIAGDLAYREFYIKPLGVAYLVEQFPEIVSIDDMTAASPEMMILSPVAFEPDCANWVWGCYSVEGYRRVAHVYVMRQHGGLNEVIPCDPGGCSDGREYKIRELSPEESESVGRRKDGRDDIVNSCHSKIVLSYVMRACRQEYRLDGKLVTYNYVLQTTSPMYLRFLVDWPWTTEIKYNVNFVSGNTRIIGGSAGLLERSM